MTYRELYDYGVLKLSEADIAEAKLDARILLEYICHTDRNALLVHGDMERSSLEESFYRTVIEKRALHIPLQHITGEQEFMGLTFKVNEHTLIPRQDTEILVEEAMRHLHDGMRILDMCTGSGCILLSLLKYSNECEGIGIDISEKALQVAEQNADLLGISAQFCKSDLFERVDGFFDMIVSNPPYIATNEIASLMPEVREHEPIAALDGLEDGLHFYRIIVEKATDHLCKGGRIFLEIGYDQAEAVSNLLQEAGFQEIKTVKDYAGLDRVVKARWI